MNHVVKIFRSFIAGMLFAAVAMPATAAPQPEKTFSIKMAGSGPYTAKFTNEQPPSANSTINSIELWVPSGVTVSGAPTTTPPSNPNNVTIVTESGQLKIKVSNLNPINPQQFVTISFSTTNSPLACASWGGAAYTGSNFSGQNFRLLPPPASVLAVAGGGACSLNFTPDPPKNGIANVKLSPVTITANGGPLTGDVVMTSDCALTGTTTVTAVGGSAIFNNLFISTIGTCKLTATAQSPGYTPATSQSFTVFAGGPLKCEPGIPFAFSGILPPGVTNISQPGYAEGQRGPFNKDGSQCIAVGYTFTNDILGSNSASLTWDVASQPGAAFKYTVTWKPEYVDATTGMPTRITKVAWYDSTGLVLGPVVPGRACLSPDLPEPYGTLSGGIDNVVTSIVINTAGGIAPLPTVPFALVIGNERMTAVSGSGGSYTVTRGGSNGTTAAAHATGAIVMTTPLPLDGSGIQMRMCIAEEGWTAYPPGVNDCATSATPNPKIPALPPTTPLACVSYTTTVFDIGDGYIIRAP